MGMTSFSKPVQLEAGVGIVGFCCGCEIVDEWVKKHSAHARERGTAVVYVSYADGLAAGFYTLSAHSVERSAIIGGWLQRNAPEQIPVVLLGMMGVDARFQGTGLGAQLLRDAIINSQKIAGLLGARALIVDPVDEPSASFYAHFGFSVLPGTNRMALKL